MAVTDIVIVIAPSHKHGSTTRHCNGVLCHYAHTLSQQVSAQDRRQTDRLCSTGAATPWEAAQLFAWHVSRQSAMYHASLSCITPVCHASNCWMPLHVNSTWPMGATSDCLVTCGYSVRDMLWPVGQPQSAYNVAVRWVAICLIRLQPVGRLPSQSCHVCWEVNLPGMGQYHLWRLWSCKMLPVLLSLANSFSSAAHWQCSPICSSLLQATTALSCCLSCIHTATVGAPSIQSKAHPQLGYPTCKLSHSGFSHIWHLTPFKPLQSHVITLPSASLCLEPHTVHMHAAKVLVIPIVLTRSYCKARDNHTGIQQVMTAVVEHGHHDTWAQ